MTTKKPDLHVIKPTSPAAEPAASVDNAPADAADLDTENSMVPGCGLGIYTMLLFSIFLLGLLGMAASTMGIFFNGGDPPGALLSGHEVQDYRLTAMREAGLLAADEKPLAWHDETFELSGNTACGLTEDRLIRISQEGPRSIDYLQIDAVERIDSPDGGTIVLSTASADANIKAIGCRFRKDEGGTNFQRMIQVEMLKKERGQ